MQEKNQPKKNKPKVTSWPEFLLAGVLTSTLGVAGNYMVVGIISMPEIGVTKAKKQVRYIC